MITQRKDLRRILELPNPFEVFFMLKKSRSIEKSPKPEGIGDFEVQKEKSALAELRSATGGLQAVLKQYFCRFPCIIKAFRAPTRRFPLRVNPSNLLSFPRYLVLI